MSGNTKSTQRARQHPLVLLMSALGLLLAVGNHAKGDYVFGAPENLGPGVNGPGFQTLAGISMDDLSLYFLESPGQLWISERATKDDPWGTARYLGLLTPESISTTAASIGFLPTVTTADGLEGYYAATLSNGLGGVDLWYMTRNSAEDMWGPLMNVGSVVNTEYDEHLACVSPDGLELYFSGSTSTERVRPGGSGLSDLWVARRATRDAAWTEPVNLGPAINTPYMDLRPSISPDGLLLFFDSSRPGGSGNVDLYVTRRTSLSDPWQEPVNLGPVVNTPTVEECARISADGSTLYWDSPRPGSNGDNDLWQVSITPTFDFNGDGAVDCLDVCDLTDHWGEDSVLYDIGPTPFGDGVVDAKDLLVLAEHMVRSATDVNDVNGL